MSKPRLEDLDLEIHDGDYRLLAKFEYVTFHQRIPLDAKPKQLRKALLAIVANIQDSIDQGDF